MHSAMDSWDRALFAIATLRRSGVHSQRKVKDSTRVKNLVRLSSTLYAPVTWGGLNLTNYENENMTKRRKKHTHT